MAWEKMLDTLIGIFVFVTVTAAVVPFVLSSFLNLSGAGLALGILFSSILGIVFAVYIFKAIIQLMRSGVAGGMGGQSRKR